MFQRLIARVLGPLLTRALEREFAARRRAGA